MTHEKRTAALGTDKIGSLLIKYSIPAIVGMLVNSLYNIVDRIFIGQGVGAMAISGLAITFPIMILQAAFGMLIGIGAASRISIALGQKDKVLAEKILGNSIILSLSISTFYVLGMLFFLDDILSLFGGTAHTIPYAREYLLIIIPGSYFSTLTYSFNNVLRATGYPTKAMLVLLGGAILNTLLDWIFIFYFDWGVRGAAVATVISMAATTFPVMQHYFSNDSYIRFRRSALKLEVPVILSITSIGLSPFLMNIAASLVNVILNNSLLLHGGELAIGAYGIINSFAILIIMCIIGLCQGMQPIVGFNYGAKEMIRVKETLFLTIRIASVMSIVGFAIAMVFPSQIAQAFTPDKELSDLAVVGMQTALFMLPIVGFQIVTSSFFQSIGLVKVSIFLSLSRQVLFLIPMILILPRFFGLKGVWLATPSSDVISASLTLIILYYNRKIFKLPPTPEP